MATLTVRNLPEDVHKALRIRAARHGRSMEAEARAVLTETVAGEKLSGAAAVERLQQAFLRAFGGQRPDWTVDDFLAERRRQAQREFAELSPDRDRDERT